MSRYFCIKTSFILINKKKKYFIECFKELKSGNEIITLKDMNKGQFIKCARRLGGMRAQTKASGT